MRASRVRRAAAAGLPVVATLVVAAPVLADTTTHRIAVDHSPVSGPGAGARTAHIRARMEFPSDWRTRRGSATRATLVEQTGGCRYLVTARARVVTAAQPDAAALAAATVPADQPRSLLDAGSRGTAAWRVAKLGGGDRIRLTAVWARSGARIEAALALPAGVRAYDEIVVSATSVAGDSCSTGNYRDVVGPEVGDALATARLTEFAD